MGGIIMKKIMFNDKYGLTQAVLDGRKTMTRRISEDQIRNSIFCKSGYESIHGYEIKPKYKVGEVVAIAQSYMDVDRFHRKGKNAAYLEYLDSILPELKLYPGWGNKMFVKADLMPHHIKITGIKVERLQDISDEDCLKEGIFEWDAGQKDIPFYSFSYADIPDYFTPRDAFADLIDEVSGKGVFQSNPYVFAYEFVLVD
jgi:hypothetical protein